ncbi:hypothetical protein F2Q70_00016446 [Brassica cretica]|uniref:Uncharacterized protein n=1 Tax=Brassica cretica TaxID=69181 RepID=A0A8S9HXW9_BRACR|nr:hypothetical protein F2Q70_00016446 [Brassica cretica]
MAASEQMMVFRFSGITRALGYTDGVVNRRSNLATAEGLSIENRGEDLSSMLHLLVGMLMGQGLHCRLLGVVKEMDQSES